MLIALFKNSNLFSPLSICLFFKVSITYMYNIVNLQYKTLQCNAYMYNYENNQIFYLLETIKTLSH